MFQLRRRLQVGFERNSPTGQIKCYVRIPCGNCSDEGHGWHLQQLTVKQAGNSPNIISESSTHQPFHGALRSHCPSPSKLSAGQTALLLMKYASCLRSSPASGGNVPLVTSQGYRASKSAIPSIFGFFPGAG